MYLKVMFQFHGFHPQSVSSSHGQLRLVTIVTVHLASSAVQLLLQIFISFCSLTQWVLRFFTNWGIRLTNHLNKTLKLRLTGAVHFHLLYAFMAWTRTALRLTFYHCA